MCLLTLAHGRVFLPVFCDFRIWSSIWQGLVSPIENAPPEKFCVCSWWAKRPKSHQPGSTFKALSLIFTWSLNPKCYVTGITNLPQGSYGVSFCAYSIVFWFPFILSLCIYALVCLWLQLYFERMFAPFCLTCSGVL